MFDRMRCVYYVREHISTLVTLADCSSEHTTWQNVILCNACRVYLLNQYKTINTYISCTGLEYSVSTINYRHDTSRSRSYTEAFLVCIFPSRCRSNQIS